jgi:hypothetical protein
MGGPGEGLLNGDFERQFSIWRALPLQSLRDTYKKAQETGTCVGRAPSANMEETLLYRGLV